MGKVAIIAAARTLSLRMIFPRARDWRECDVLIERDTRELQHFQKCLQFHLAGKYFDMVRALREWQAAQVEEQPSEFSE